MNVKECVSALVNKMACLIFAKCVFVKCVCVVTSLLWVWFHFYMNTKERVSALLNKIACLIFLKLTHISIFLKCVLINTHFKNIRQDQHTFQEYEAGKCVLRI